MEVSVLSGTLVDDAAHGVWAENSMKQLNGCGRDSHGDDLKS